MCVLRHFPFKKIIAVLMIYKYNYDQCDTIVYALI